MTCLLNADPDWLDAWRDQLRIHLAKSAGYGTTQDRLGNFTAVANMTGDPAWLYPLRRMTEKLARCESLAAQGRVAEIVEEAGDLAGLALCVKALLARG